MNAFQIHRKPFYSTFTIREFYYEECLDFFPFLNRSKELRFIVIRVDPFQSLKRVNEHWSTESVSDSNFEEDDARGIETRGEGEKKSWRRERRQMEKNLHVFTWCSARSNSYVWDTIKRSGRKRKKARETSREWPSWLRPPPSASFSTSWPFEQNEST